MPPYKQKKLHFPWADFNLAKPSAVQFFSFDDVINQEASSARDFTFDKQSSFSRTELAEHIEHHGSLELKPDLKQHEVVLHPDEPFCVNFQSNLTRQNFQTERSCKGKVQRDEIGKATVRPHMCETCGRRFTLLENLHRHLMLHTNERPYKCQHCGKTFKLSQHLKEHVRIHTGEKPYKCHICGHAFCQISNLKSHQRTHSKIKAFKCDRCGKAFRRAFTLKQHLVSHINAEQFMQQAVSASTIRSSIKKESTKTRNTGLKRNGMTRSQKNWIAAYKSWPIEEPYHLKMSHDGGPLSTSTLTNDSEEADANYANAASEPHHIREELQRSSPRLLTIDNEDQHPCNGLILDLSNKRADQQHEKDRSGQEAADHPASLLSDAGVSSKTIVDIGFNKILFDSDKRDFDKKQDNFTKRCSDFTRRQDDGNTSLLHRQRCEKRSSYEQADATTLTLERLIAAKRKECTAEKRRKTTDAPASHDDRLRSLLISNKVLCSNIQGNPEVKNSPRKDWTADDTISAYSSIYQRTWKPAISKTAENPNHPSPPSFTSSTTYLGENISPGKVDTRSVETTPNITELQAFSHFYRGHASIINPGFLGNGQRLFRADRSPFVPLFEWKPVIIGWKNILDGTFRIACSQRQNS